MNKKTKDMRETLKRVLATRDDAGFIEMLILCFDDVLSLNDFNTLIERLKEEVE